MNRQMTLTVCVAFVLSSIAALAQMGPQAPAPELKKLDYFAGNWTSEATIAAGPWGAGGKFTDSVHGEWMKGGFYFVDHSDFSMPADMGGAATSLAILGYDTEKKVYTEQRFDSTGRHVVMTGTLDGDTLTWTGENNYNGMPIKSRFTIKMISPTSFTSKYEVSGDGGTTWLPFWEGKATKK
jgi:Protein of unknown function (DUF1579)